MRNIHKIIEDGDLDELREAVKMGIDVDEQHYEESDGETALFFANPEQAKILIAAGSNVNHVNDKGDNALFHIDYLENVSQQYKKMEILLKAGININQNDNYGKSCLFSGSLNLKMIKLLEKYNIDLKHTDKHGRNVLNHLYYDEQLPVVKYLVEEKGVPVLNDLISNQTILFSLYSPKIAQFYINKGVDINHVDDEGNTALMTAHTKEMMEFLILNHCALHQVNNEGKNAIDYCCYYSQFVQLLLERNVDILSPLKNYEMYKESYKLIKHRFDILEEKNIINAAINNPVSNESLTVKKRL